MDCLTMEHITAICSVLGLGGVFAAIYQLLDNVKATRVNNSLEMLSWFDDKDIVEILSTIDEIQNWNNSKKLPLKYDGTEESDYERKSRMVVDKLLYILDTMCVLIKTQQYEPNFLNSFKLDICNINDNETIKKYIAHLKSKYKDAFPYENLDFTLLLNTTKKK